MKTSTSLSAACWHFVRIKTSINGPFRSLSRLDRIEAECVGAAKIETHSFSDLRWMKGNQMLRNVMLCNRHHFENMTLSVIQWEMDSESMVTALLTLVVLDNVEEIATQMNSQFVNIRISVGYTSKVSYP